jgi:hypothetical protein
MVSALGSWISKEAAYGPRPLYPGSALDSTPCYHCICPAILAFVQERPFPSDLIHESCIGYGVANIESPAVTL